MCLANLIEEATERCNKTGLIGQARNETHMVRVQVLDRQTRKTRPTYRTDVWALPTGRRLPKAEWAEELNK